MLLKFFFYLMCWFTVFYVLRFSLVFQDLCDLIVPYIYEHFGLCLLFIKISTKKNYIVSHECKQSPNPSDVESFIRLSNFKYFASVYVGKKWVITARILSIEFSVDTLYSFLDVRFQTRILSIFSSGFSIYLSNLIGLSVFWG